VLEAGCPRVTHPFAARASSPKGRASLDLHVLSTPPAFVLSQDQTLREGIYDNPASPSEEGWPLVDTESRCLGDSFNHWSKRADNKLSLLDLYQRNLKDDPEGSPTRVVAFYGTNFRHAVEFSRSGRTPSRPFRGDLGQPESRYSGRKAQVKRLVPASFPLGRRTRSAQEAARGASRLGDVRPAPRGTLAIPISGTLRGGPLWLRPSNKENISQLARHESNPLRKRSGGPDLLGYRAPDRCVHQVSGRGRVL
jgi:hypothetical protein